MPRVTIDIGANDNASSILSKVSKAIEATAKSTDSMTASVFKGNMYFEVAKKGLDILSNATIGFGQSALKASGQAEQINISLKTMLGSQEKASAMMRQMQKAATETPFEMTDIAQGGKNLIAFGIEADEVISTMVMLGDVASGVGIPINDLIVKYGQLRTQQTMYGQDLKEFQGRGIPIVEALAKVLNKNETAIKGMVSAGQIGFNDVKKAFELLTGSGGKFHDLMKEQSKSLNGQISNLNDSYELLLAKLGKGMEDNAKRGVAALSSLLKEGGILNDAFNKLGGAIDWALGKVVSVMEKADTTYRTFNGTANDFKKAIADIQDQLNYDSASLGMEGMIEGVEGVSEETKRLVDLQKKYQEYLDKGYKSWEDVKKAEEEAQAKKDKALLASGKKPKDQSTPVDKGYAKHSKDAQKFYEDMVKRYEMDRASEAEKIDLKLEYLKQDIEKRKAYFKDSQQYLELLSIAEAEAERERYKETYKDASEFYGMLGDLNTEFCTNTTNESVNAFGEMMNTIMDSVKNVSKAYSDVLKDIGDRSQQAGMTFGDAFQVGSQVAVAALESVAAVMQMQYALAKAGYDAQIEALHEKMQAELDAYDESLENASSYEEEKDALRLLELEAYADSLQGKTDSEVEYALEKKRLELQSAADAEKAAKKEEEAKEKIEQKYAMAEYEIEVQAFKAEQDYNRSMIKIQTAIGIITAWASCMKLGPILGPIAGAALTGLFLGVAKKQESLLDQQKPPEPPKFARGVRNFEGGLALVGEEGTELVGLPRGSNVYTHSESNDMLGPRYVINNIYIDSTLISKVVSDLRRSSSYGGY